jgi:8-oxo-dGTP pyrophosphatase MutT (NUDIX family)
VDEPAERVAVPAATVVLVRDGARGLEVLYLRRSASVDFHGGAWVFPGGRIDPGDYAAERPDDVDAAARRAAVREAREEAGLVVDPTMLHHFAHWTTSLGAPKRFATWFFAGRAGDGDVQVDGGEISDHRWLRPDEALAAQRAREIELPAPTFVTSLALSTVATAGEALARFASRPPERFRPRICAHAEGRVSLYEPDVAYADGDLERAGARHRLWMLRSGWRYEREF